MSDSIGRMVSSGKYITTSGYSLSTNTIGPFSNVKFIPFDVQDDCIIDRIGCYITAWISDAGFSAPLQFGIYNFYQGEFSDNSQLLISGTVDISLLVAPFVAEITVSQHLVRGMYVLGIGIPEGGVATVTLRALNIFKIHFTPYFKKSTALATVEISYYSYTSGGLYQPLPPTLSAISPATLTEETGTSIPMIFTRVA